jgi:hypothetical protein
MPTSSALSAEALVVQSGLFPKGPLGPKDAAAAERLPKDWSERVRAFFDRAKPLKVKRVRQVPYLSTWNRLATPHRADDADAITGVMNQEIADAYLAQLRRCREYLRAQWRPMRQVTLLRSKLLPPATSEQQRASALYVLVEDPTRVLDLLEQNCLMSTDVGTLEEVYPELAKMLDALVDAEIIARRTAKQSWDPLYWQEQGLRTLKGLPSGQPMTEIEPQKAEAPPKVEIDIKRKPNYSPAAALDSTRAG